VKPALNAKLGLVTEGTYSPSVAVGIMEVSPALPAMDYLFVSATKTLGSYGRLTLGFGDDVGDRSIFSGSFPFTAGARQAVMAAYESPLALDKVGLVGDYFGGLSEVSDVYLGATVALSSTTTFALGAFLDNDRSTPATRYDGLFAYLTASVDVIKLFSQAPPSTHETATLFRDGGRGYSWFTCVSPKLSSPAVDGQPTMTRNTSSTNSAIAMSLNRVALERPGQS
jgi:hypothetical protein